MHTFDVNLCFQVEYSKDIHIQKVCTFIKGPVPKKHNMVICVCHLLAGWFLAHLIFSTWKIEAICSSESSVDTPRTTRRYIPENGTLHNHRCANLNSYMVISFEHRFLPELLYRSVTLRVLYLLFGSDNTIYLSIYYILQVYNMFQHFGHHELSHMQLELKNCW
jgi:hypothetical protein